MNDIEIAEKRGFWRGIFSSVGFALIFPVVLWPFLHFTDPHRAEMIMDAMRVQEDGHVFVISYDPNAKNTWVLRSGNGATTVIVSEEARSKAIIDKVKKALR